jgi:RNA polymerase sigma-70 factor, ECF subfamily
MQNSEFSTQQKIRKGDINAFESLFRQYYKLLCQFAVKYVKDKDTAEEIVQDFFYQYWKNRETMTITVSLKAYLYMSVRNNSLKYLRQKGVRQKYADDVYAKLTHSELQTQQDNLDVKELQNKIDEILDQMPERCATIFRMSRYEGLKYREIAHALSISVKTVEANMGKALQTLREKLHNYNYYPY